MIDLIERTLERKNYKAKNSFTRISCRKKEVVQKLGDI